MREFAKPRVVVSRCIEFDHCRYNGQMIASDFVASLAPYVEFLPVCPEVEIGLGVPRDSVRLVSSALKGGEVGDRGEAVVGAEGCAGGEGGRGEGGKGGVANISLIQPTTGRDVTADMNSFAARHLDSVGDVDGFILKASSPSCGIRNTKVYPTAGKSAAISRSGSGLFGGAVLARYPELSVEDEGRLRNPRIKEHFLSKLFALASFREAKRSGSMKELVGFQTENKMLLMAYHQAETKALGKIAANHDHRPFSEVAASYELHLRRALCRPRRYTSNINVLMHILGHFSDSISEGERKLFLENIQRYRDGKITICPNTTILKSWIARFDDDYLSSQTFFEPYPQDLMEVDPVVSHRGRDLWR
ncbi:DUF523 and DUF1722 domain-containing protein [Candidatus Methanocrinis natronophilus]|uniref:DUF1722 domain-containing protein n=1 Tax=Candidatus Methanocrinis natronophilus TaxID=3033396 RepID=A0ABT5X8L7_9EURY|nr:DUF1722 domain-containing protein [Candidatus Methanocrinis natronophilus]MDF0591044.1 DUF1722 domain-containing protein [Candidatus Methanocrinis natronophilus]